MPNLRIVENVAALAVLTASSTAGALAVTNLQNNDKTKIWRATGTSARLTATFAASEIVSLVAFPFCNLSSADTMRVRLSNELSVTNLIKFSEQIDNALWTKSSTTISATPALAPDGTTTAEKVQESTTTSILHYVQQSVSGLLLGQQVAFSFYVKAAERGFAALLFDSASTSAPATSQVFVNLATGALTGATGAWAFTVESAPNGYWRVKAVGTITASGGVLCPRILPAISASSHTYAGTVGSGIYVWGAQLEVGSKATSYYPSAASSGVRPDGYIDSWQSYDYDSGFALACPAPAVRLQGWTATQAASAYAYGGGAYARAWFAPKPALGVAIDLAGPGNPQGFLEAACLVIGNYFSPEVNAAWGASMTWQTTSAPYRSQAGSLRGNRGTRYRQLSFTLNDLPPADRETFANLLRSSGNDYPLFISIYPESPDLALERDHMVYGCLSQLSKMTIPYWNAYSAPVQIDEV